jgi:hypothetical protein
MMNPLKQQLFNILKHTRIDIEPGKPLDIRLLLEEMQSLQLLTEFEINIILEGI